MEVIQEKVPRQVRHKELVEVLEQGSTKNPKQYNVKPLMSYIANLMEQAYLAGYNKVNLSEKIEGNKFIEYGEPLVKAQVYVKDKGLRV